MINPLDTIRRRLQQLVTPTPDEFVAMLGNKQGTVRVSGSTVYVTTFEGQEFEVINRQGPNNPGQVVKVGKRPGSNALEVLYYYNLSSALPTSNNVAFSVQEHAPTHQYPGYDTVFVRLEQILYLLVLPVSGYTVKIFSGTISKTDVQGYVFYAGESLDLTAYIPASGAKWIVLEILDNGTISVVSGAEYASRDDLTLTNVPTSNYRRICAIIADSSYQDFERSDSRNDFLDLRFATQVPFITKKYRSLMWESISDSSGIGWSFLYDHDNPDEPMWSLENLE